MLETLISSMYKIEISYLKNIRDNTTVLIPAIAMNVNGVSALIKSNVDST